MNLPVEFLSGKIHKFQLHVPWTRITYEPVVITIDTMEFIVKLKEPADAATHSHVEKPAEEETSATEEPADLPTISEDLPPGYVQGILNKVVIVSLICLIVCFCYPTFCWPKLDVAKL